MRNRFWTHLGMQKSKQRRCRLLGFGNQCAYIVTAGWHFGALRSRRTSATETNLRLIFHFHGFLLNAIRMIGASKCHEKPKVLRLHVLQVLSSAAVDVAG